jgi:hypothetical protein
MSKRFETILAHNARIGQLLRQTKADLEAIGEPEYFTALAYDFQDIAAELAYMAPRTDASAQRKIQDYADEKDAEDARDAMATRADFMRDRRLTE